MESCVAVRSSAICRTSSSAAAKAADPNAGGVGTGSQHAGQTGTVPVNGSKNRSVVARADAACGPAVPFSAATIALYCATLGSANMRTEAGTFMRCSTTRSRATWFHATVAPACGRSAAAFVDGRGRSTAAVGAWQVPTAAAPVSA